MATQTPIEDLGTAAENGAPLFRSGEERRDKARYLLIVIFGAVFLLTVIWMLVSASYGNSDTWAQVKEAALILMPVEATLLGATVAFYFTVGK